MKLRDEHIRSYIDDIRQWGLLDYLTWRGADVAPAWIGAHEPATRSDDFALHSLARFNRDHYLFYRALVERHMEKQGDVMDVGCGSGARAAMLARYADSVLGIDCEMPKISAASILNPAVNVSWYFAEFMEWSQCHEDTFDYVFAVEVVEHIVLAAQKPFIMAMASKVKPGGALLLTTPRDKEPDRKPPHIGLWDDGIADMRVQDLGAALSYFNVKQLTDGGESPWCEKDVATHYVVVARR